MLSDAGLLAERRAGALEIVPFSEAQLKGASYVLRLARRFRRWTAGDAPIRLWSQGAAGDALGPVIEEEHFRLDPGDLALGSTLESIRLSPRLAGQVSPLSHVARFGLGVTGGADLVNPGFGGAGPSALVLELYNHGPRPLELMAGMPIAHLRVVALSGPSERAAHPGVYDGADPLSAPLFHEEWARRLEKGA